MQDEHFNGFHLAGGTALSLYLGHRKSIDLDLFTKNDFNTSQFSDYLIKEYDFKESYRAKNTLKGIIGNIKIDCIAHKYENIDPIYTADNIRLYGMKDIAAMKLNAIADNGTRLKDFIDIACLSTQISLSDMLESYQKKYPNTNAITALRALTYYKDIIKEPIMLIKGNYKWDFIETRIGDMIKKDTATFTSFPFK
jgi:hypothetical protein